MTTNNASALPSLLKEVALVDATTAATTGQMSASWWYEEVRNGRAPQPVIRTNRCTRWREADVAQFWSARATAAANDGDALVHRAKTAGAKAAEKKRAARLSPDQT